MTELFLVRHAHAVWTPDEMRPLSPRGHRDAQAIADALDGERLCAIYSSPYMRARQSVEPLAARLGLPIVEVADLRERQLSSGEVEDFRAAVRATWDDPDFTHEGGEPNREARTRVRAACQAMLERHADSGVAVATHGSLLTLLLSSFDPSVGFEFWSRISEPDIYCLAVGPSDAQFSIRRVWSDASTSTRRLHPPPRHRPSPSNSPSPPPGGPCCE
jgi:2,3-bisphosphoglycerate-dependent phosphoglycerate mutase